MQKVKKTHWEDPEKEFMITKSSIMEIQNLAVNTKLWTIKSNPEQHQFLFKHISSKNQWQHFSK